MKAFHKVAAALATLPVAGMIALTGAGIASAATCPAGQHWNDMGGGSGFCSPDASGGGTGGNGSVDLGGTNTPAPQAPVFNQPAPYKPPVYGPAPIQPIPAQPAPARQAPIQQAPIQPAPAPVHNYAPNVPAERSIPAQNSTNGSVENEAVAAAPGTAVSAPKKAAADAHKETATDKNADEKAEEKSTVPVVVATTESASPTPSTSEKASEIPNADLSRSSSAQPVINTVIIIVVLALVWQLLRNVAIPMFRNRKKSQENESRE